MSKPKPSTDRHKGNVMVRLRPPLAVVMRELAAERATDLTEEVNRAVREMLEREGKWPPVQKSAAEDK